ncbi:MAG: DegT/DnrJ/EryC1/StrS family aminotransferase [Propionibacteriaceae bacterium]|jgi:dTDP-4-amino-4,6-dideoxygalactose transaminase|nr:DegT/DnrJ/EryC1/StrS family aminotransferase [Propionibacteriaceae bacterium]
MSAQSVVVPLNDLARSLAGQRDDLMRVIGQVLDSGWLVLGEQVRRFEAELAALCGAAHGIGVASGTDALELCLRASISSERPVVVTAANCGGYTSTAARRAGLTPRYADVEERTHLLSPATVAAVLDDRVGAVVVTHLFGRAADSVALAELCHGRGIALIEDCAQAIGARRDGRVVGSVGDAAAFSFYPTKNLGALGDGGAVVTSSDQIRCRVLALRQYGWDREKYVVSVPGGMNSRLDELQAAVLRLRLGGVEAAGRRRREIVAAYRAAAGPSLRVLPAEGEGHVAHLAVMEVDDRDQVRQRLKAKGVGTDVHYPVPDHRQPAHAAQYADVHLPVTERLAGRIVSLPLFTELTDDEVDRVCAALAEL